MGKIVQNRMNDQQYSTVQYSLSSVLVKVIGYFTVIEYVDVVIE